MRKITLFNIQSDIQLIEQKKLQETDAMENFKLKVEKASLQ